MRHLVAAALLCCLCAPARAELDLKLSGWVSSDIRYRIAGVEPRDPPVPSQWQLLNNGWSRNENRVRAALSIGLGSKVKAVADAELMMFGFSDLRDLDSSTLRDRVDPYYLELHAAYVDINHLLPGLDLRIGRQVVPWGAADKFNPVSNLNTLDLSDPLQFGRALANNMIRADYQVPLLDVTLTAVVVPVFRPAQLPRTAPIALLDPLRPPPISDELVARAIDDGRQIYLVDRPECQDALRRMLPACNPLTVDVSVLQPEISGRNTQFAFRIARSIFGQDVALSYYRGRFGIPVPVYSLLTGTLTQTVARIALHYPRVDVLGLEVAGSIQKLGGLGYWAELGINFPEEARLGLYEEVLTGQLRAIEYLRQPDGTVAPSFSPLGSHAPERPVVVERTPFWKGTFGVDYSIGAHVYVNLQYVHGFIDEFGAGRAPRPRRDAKNVQEQPRWETRIGDYLVGGVDVKVLSDRLLLRLFGVFKLPSLDWATQRFDDWVPTGVLFPQVVWTVWDATELMIGGFLMLGDRSSKFGDPAAGGSELFVKARVSF
ncbi:MAG: DUF1302 family protein [Myxococcales bacterium]|nr:hypothetical protein [Myxococcota bacterium]MDW8280369.1 DUF1302 family protein [Myxococcales bacterium]